MEGQGTSLQAFLVSKETRAMVPLEQSGDEEESKANADVPKRETVEKK